MKITLKPSDIIKRFLWDKYSYFCLQDKTNAEIDKIIKEDKEFEICENDAFVIGLSCVVYTDSVIYKYKLFLKEMLENKCFDYVQPTDADLSGDTDDDKEESEDDDDVYVAPKLMINKDIMMDSAKSFLNKIPKSWDVNNESNTFISELAQIKDLYIKFTDKLNKLPVTSINDWGCVKYVSVKKIINKIIK